MAIFFILFLAAAAVFALAYFAPSMIAAFQLARGITDRIAAPVEYHYRHCKTCDYTYMVSSEYVGPDPGCPACGAESWDTETTGLLHQYIKGKWQDIAEPRRLTRAELDIATHPEIAAMTPRQRNRYTPPSPTAPPLPPIPPPKPRLPRDLENISTHSALWDDTLPRIDD